MAITKDNVGNIHPLSPLQEGMLFHALLEPESKAYRQQMVVDLEGEVDVARFGRALAVLIERHESLRSVFAATGAERPLQVVLKRRDPDLTYEDFRRYPALTRAERAAASIARDRDRGFNLATGSLLRVLIVQLDERHFQVVWSHHHILMDGWSLARLQSEFLAVYAALRLERAFDLPALTSYSRYVKFLEQRDPDAAEQYWSSVVGDCCQVAVIPHLDGTSYASRESGLASSVEHREIAIDADTTASLIRLASDNGATLNSVIQALWAVLLGRYNRSDDVVFGSVVTVRPAEIPNVENLIGLCINTVPVRVCPRRDLTLATLIGQVQREAAAREPHQHFPLARIQALAPLTHDLIGTVLAFESYPVDASLERLAENDELGFAVRGTHAAEQTHYPLVVQIFPERSLRVRVCFDVARYTAAQAQAVAEQMRLLLGAAAESRSIRIDDLPLLSDDARDSILRDFNPDGLADTSPHTLASRFEDVARRWPERIALTDGERRFDYRTLDERSAQLAERLAAAGAGPEDRVGLALERSAELVIGLVATLRCGAAYVPLDPRYPAERLAYIADDAGVSMVIGSAATRSKVESVAGGVPFIDIDSEAPGHPVAAPRVARAENLAYVIYTSGSTGQPKGVAVSHRNVLRLFDAASPPLRFDERDVWTLFHSSAFDFSVWEIWGALLHGGELVVVTYEQSRSPDAFYRLLAERGVTVLNQTPSAFRQLAGVDAAAPLALRTVVFGGEALAVEDLRDWFTRHGDRRPRLVNMYGITETTVHVTQHAMDLADLDGPQSIIGAPLADLRAFVLDRRFEPVPIGVAGEIHVAGPGLARGYLGRAALTAERFVPCPFLGAGERMYRTGDLARHLPDGGLEYLGRIDEQVQLRGFRVEPGEVAAALATHPAIGEAVVVSDGNEPGRADRLVAYLVGAELPTPDAAALRAYLAVRLPEYMVPAAFVTLQSMPLTANGKLDRRALPSANDQHLGRGRYVAPRNTMEERLAEVWSQVLAVPEVGVDDNYFALGGDSITAIRLVSRLLKAGIDVELRDLFRHPSVAELAPHAGVTASNAPARAAAADAALTPIQARFVASHTVEPNRFNHAVVIESATGFDADALACALEAVQRTHEALRLRLNRSDGVWRQSPGPVEMPIAFEVADLSNESDPERALTRVADALQGGFDLTAGPLLRALLARTLGRERLVLVAHHFAVDGMSWRILFEDLSRAYRCALDRRPIELPEVPTPFTGWVHALRAFAGNDEVRREREHWVSTLRTATQPLPDCPPVRDCGRFGDTCTESVHLDAEPTGQLLRDANRAYRTTTEELVLAALARALAAWHGGARTLVALEGHGREPLDAGVDASRTVGWLTSLYPIVLELAEGRDLAYQIKHVKETLRKVPRAGIGYGLLRYALNDDAGADPDLQREPEVSFNYFGRFDAGLGDGLSLADPGIAGRSVSDDAARGFELELVGVVIADRLTLSAHFATERVRATGPRKLLDHWCAALEAIIAHCVAQGRSELTPSDLSYRDLSLDELEDLIS